MPAPADTLDHFHHELTLARREALAILRRAMQPHRATPPPTKDQLRAAIAILRLPKHVCDLPTPPGQAGDEPPSPPSPPLPPTANPRVSPSPTPPALNDSAGSAAPTLSPNTDHLPLPPSLAHIPRHLLTPQMVIAAFDDEIAQLHRKLARSIASRSPTPASTPRPPPGDPPDPQT